jgi:hypothetical protein
MASATVTAAAMLIVRIAIEWYAPPCHSCR